jgi:hypothetical protein
VQALPEELVELDVGSEMAESMNETMTYTLTTNRLCRNNSIMPVVILKALEVVAGIFLAESCAIEFIERAV